MAKKEKRKVSATIRAKIRKDSPELGDEILNMALGIFVLCTSYNHTLDKPVNFGEALGVTLQGLGELFTNEDIYAWCVKSFSEMQEEKKLIQEPGSKIIIP